jgi:ribosomal protein L11 methyltransferase
MSREFIREDYLRLELEFTPVLPAREIAIAWLSELEFEVFESTDTGLIAHTPLISINKEDLEDVKTRLEVVVESMVWDESVVKTENWNAKWESEYEPVNVEDLAMVRAPFHSAPELGIDVIIKPNMSFGTGHHDTTWMMIKALLQLETKGASVLDMGCGTGVLALAAVKLGASEVLAIDIEEGAVENTRDNALLNGLKDSISFNVACGVAELLESEFKQPQDIILANINRNVLLNDMEQYDSVLRPGGNIVFSGFFIGDVPLLEKSVRERNWDVLEVLERNGWACIICGKTEN